MRPTNATESAIGPAPTMTTLTGAAAPPFIWPVRVYWEDTDAGGIVFYANHLKFFERARTEWLRSLGVEQQTLLEQTGGMFVVSRTELHYRKPARLDDLLSVSARIVHAARASLVIEQSSCLQSGPSSTANPILCEGRIRIGWVQAQTMQPQRIPQAVLSALGITAPSPTADEAQHAPPPRD